METVNTDMLRGRVDIIVLNALSEKDGYGYDILSYIQTRTEGHYEMKQSSVYSVLKRLEKVGYIRSYSGGNESNGAKRRYYSLTDEGRVVLENEKKEWNYTRTLLDNLVSNDDFDLVNDTPPFKPSNLRPLTRRTTVVEETADIEDMAEIENEATVNGFADIAVSKSDNTTDLEENINLDKKPIGVENIVINENISDVVEVVINEKNNIIDNAFDRHMQSLSAQHRHDFLDDINVNPLENQPLKQQFANEPLKQEFGSQKEFENINSQKFNDKFDNAVTKPQNSLFEKQNINLYKDVLGSIFKNDATTHSVKNAEIQEDIDCKYMYDLKSILKNEGHHLKEYSPTTSKSTIKYVAITKLIRDSLLLSFLFYLAMALVLFLTRTSFEISKTTVLVLLGLSIIIPIGAMIIYFQNPTKKKKDNINTKLIINICFVVYLAAFMINLIFALIIPNGYSLNSLHIYAPCFLLLTIPFFGIIFVALYTSKKYYLN